MKKFLLLLIIPFLSFGQSNNDTINHDSKINLLNSKIELLETDIEIITKYSNLIFKIKKIYVEKIAIATLNKDEWIKYDIQLFPKI